MTRWMPTPLLLESRQSGQAMTEFVVSVAFVFLVLFVTVPMFGKIMDMQFQNQQASRYVAWERTVWLGGIDNSDPNHRDFAISSAEFESVAVRPTNEVINTMHNRFFNGQGRTTPTLITDEDTQAPSGAVSPIWTYVQSKNSMYQETTVESLTEKRTPGVSYAIIDTVANALDIITTPISGLLSIVGGDDRFLKIDFNRDGYYAPVVKTTLNKTNAHGGGTGVWDREDGQWGKGIEDSVFQVWDGVLTSRSGILSDGWSVQSEAYYQDRTDNLVLSNVFDMPLFDVLKTAASILEGGPTISAIYRLDFGAVGIEPMPAVDGVPLDVSCDGGYCYYDE
mgnify:CR=1 FL=1